MRVDVTVEVGELRLRNAEIAHMELRQELGAHHLCSLEFTRDEASDLLLERLLDAAVTVTLTDETGEHAAFAGQVVGGTQGHLLNAGSRFRLEAASRSIAMQMHRDMDVFENMAYTDVARRLASDAGLQLTVGEARAGERYPYLQQSGETDWEFLVRIADENGCWVRPVAGGLELRSGFDDRAWELLWGANLLALSTRCRLANPGYKGAVYQVDEKREHRFHAVRSAPALLGGATALVNAATRASHTFASGGDPGVLDDGARAPTLAAFKQRLEQESQRALGSAVGVEGTSTHPALKAGDTVHVTDAGTFKLAATGKFGVVRVAHRWDGAHYSNDFAASPWAGFTSATRPPRPLAPGFVTAEVVDNGDPQGLGRLRVRYRWQDHPARTLWMRVATPHAGNGRGMLFLPEVGDEVVVAFEQGDPERPCVMGSVWNGKDRAPHQSGVQRIVTRSGNALHLSDEQGRESVELHTATGTCLIQLSNDAGGVPTITLHAQGDLALEATGEIRMSCKRLVQKVEEDSAREVGGAEQVRIGKGLTIVSEREVAISAGSNASFQAGAILETVAGGSNIVAGATVQIQPPGHTRRTATVAQPAARPPLAHARPVPTPARGTSTSDTRTPRAGTRQLATRPPAAQQNRAPFSVTRVTGQVAGGPRGTSLQAPRNTTVVFTADQFTRAPSAAELQQIQWGVRVGGGAMEAQSTRGQQFRLRLEDRHDGQQVRVYAFMQSATDKVSAVVQVGTQRRRLANEAEGRRILQTARDSGEWRYTQGVPNTPRLYHDPRGGDCTDLVRLATRRALGTHWRSSYKASTAMFRQGDHPGFERVTAPQVGDVVVEGGHAGIYSHTDAAGKVWGWANNGSPGRGSRPYRDRETGLRPFNQGWFGNGGAHFFRAVVHP
ncbi:MAG TPA: phage baseplate assembly protein V [Longimicrobium sp.]|nr:phage baseplate assembly protein V [Longimicrobium sp.]